MAISLCTLGVGSLSYLLLHKSKLGVNSEVGGFLILAKNVTNVWVFGHIGNITLLAACI